jgi:hypothetical protein
MFSVRGGRARLSRAQQNTHSQNLRQAELALPMIEEGREEEAEHCLGERFVKNVAPSADRFGG